MNPTVKPRARKERREHGVVKSLVYALLMENPKTPVREIAKAAQCHETQVYKYRTQFQKERAQWNKSAVKTEPKPKLNGHSTKSEDGLEILIKDIQAIKNIGIDRAEAAIKAIRLILS